MKESSSCLACIQLECPGVNVNSQSSSLELLHFEVLIITQQTISLFISLRQLSRLSNSVEESFIFVIFNAYINNSFLLFCYFSSKFLQMSLSKSPLIMILFYPQNGSSYLSVFSISISTFLTSPSVILSFSLQILIR